MAVVFPQPGLAHEPEPLALAQLEAHALDGVQLAAAREVEPHVEVLHSQERSAHWPAGP